MTHDDSQRDPERDPKRDPAAESDADQLRRSDEREAVLPPTLARRLFELGESEMAKAALGASPLARATPRWRSAVPAASWSARAGWMVALAATLAWLFVPSPLRDPAAIEAPLTAAMLMDSLLVSPSLVRVGWAPSRDDAGRLARGEVVWDPVTQRGLMRFTGLAPNRPDSAQYQLWIFDAARDAAHPVDGGVFDVPSSGEVLVPIDARLRVDRVTLFAVTLERPGGVVVSGRERLVLAAPVEGPPGEG